MPSYQISRAIGWGSALFILWFLFRIHSELPGHLATHFDLAGRPNGWMSNSGFCWVMIGLSSIPNVFIRRLIRRDVRSPYVNLPFKAYWMATEERREVLAAKARGSSLRVIAFMNCLFLFICYVIYRENSGPPSPPTSAVPGVIGMLAAAGWLLLLIHLDFRPPKKCPIAGHRHTNGTENR